MANATPSTNNGNLPARLLSDPNLTVCPDFASEAFEDIRKAVDPDDAAAISKLTASWTKNNYKDKAEWILQVESDRALEEAEEARRQQEAEKEAAEAAKADEAERLEAEKKKPQLGDFDANSAPSSFVEARISLFAQKKLERREYCPLWPFTPQGLSEAAAALISSAEDVSAVRLGRTSDNQLTFQSGPSPNTHKNMVRDENLTWREFSLGRHRYIKELVNAEWPKGHVDALSRFFFILDTHSLHEEDHGSKIVQIYADRYRPALRVLETAQAHSAGVVRTAQGRLGGCAPRLRVLVLAPSWR
ncbi:hypothetical protein FB451DRAFT_1402246 [Mycena latifolia]|nr:hypothetical protein FB451DRAFT_1402246 [Mycena latifolia]